MAETLADCQNAKKRLVDQILPFSQDKSTKHVADIVSLFITLMDSIKLEYIAKDQIHPQLCDLTAALAKTSIVLDGKQSIVGWMKELNKMGASDELDQNQTRQLLFDLETTYQEFQSKL
jgi:ESCRT-I complex subunit VPS28